MARKGAFCIIYDQGKVLLVKRTDFPLWDLPGGGIKEDESETEAALREAREETGFSIRVNYMIGKYERPEVNDTQFIFSAEIIGGKAIYKGDETANLKWFALNSLPFLIVAHRKGQIKDFSIGCKNKKEVLKEPIINKLFKR